MPMAEQLSLMQRSSIAKTDLMRQMLYKRAIHINIGQSASTSIGREMQVCPPLKIGTGKRSVRGQTHTDIKTKIVTRGIKMTTEATGISQAKQGIGMMTEAADGTGMKMIGSIRVVASWF